MPRSQLGPRPAPPFPSLRCWLLIAGARLPVWELGSEPGSQQGKASGDPVCWGSIHSAPPSSEVSRLARQVELLWCPLYWGPEFWGVLHSSHGAPLRQSWDSAQGGLTWESQRASRWGGCLH